MRAYWAHDVEGLLDRRGEAAETQAAVDLDHLLDDLDEDRNADRVDDLGSRQVEQQNLEALVDQLVGDLGDLLATLVVDVTLGVDHRQAIAAVHRHLQTLRHRLFPVRSF
jgi:hypothetical protein